MLNKVAAALAVLTAAIHLFVGGAGALAPTLAAGLPAPAEGAMHASWHIVSVFLIWSAVVFWRGGDTARHFALLWLMAAVLFIYVGLRQSGPSGLMVNPQWTILGLTGMIPFISGWRAARE